MLPNQNKAAQAPPQLPATVFQANHTDKQKPQKSQNFKEKTPIKTSNRFISLEGAETMVPCNFSHADTHALQTNKEVLSREEPKGIWEIPKSTAPRSNQVKTSSGGGGHSIKFKIGMLIWADFQSTQKNDRPKIFKPKKMTELFLSPHSYPFCTTS